MTKYLQNFPASRLRRNRQSQWIRNLVSENSLSVNDLIWPVFICDGNNIKEEIASMPGVFKYSIDRLNEVTDQAVDNKINLIALFPNTPNDKKDKNGSEALNEDNLVCKALRKIKNQTLDLGIMCDVALDPYTSHGHDGLLSDTNQILNDESNEVLVKQSLLLADHKADIIAPSDMMDGRIGLIRKALENSNFKDTLLLSYAAKYASSFYGPFRDAVGSGNNLKS
nr:porphobilinogen synthase [Pelagibacterales bacterium]